MLIPSILLAFSVHQPAERPVIAEVSGFHPVAKESVRDPAFPPGMELPPQPSVSTTVAATIGQGLNAFGERIRLHLPPVGVNRVWSPFGVSLGLAGIAAVGQGPAAEEVNDALGLNRQTAGTLGLLRQDLCFGTGLQINAGCWLRWDAPLQDPAQATLANLLGQGITPIPSTSPSTDTEAQINGWIRQVAGDGMGISVNPEERMLLLTVLNFQGTWRDPFNPESTKAEPFQRLDGAAVPVPTMVTTRYLPVADLPGATLLTLPFRHQRSNSGATSRVVLALVIPGKHDGMTELAKSLSLPELARLVQEAQLERVELHLPRWSFHASPPALIETVTAAGIRHLFREGIDLTPVLGMPGDPWMVQRIEQRNSIQVDESGAKAVAVTLFGMIPGMAPPPLPPPRLLRADHPFLFALIDQTSGIVLFHGQVMDPSAP